MNRYDILKLADMGYGDVTNEGSEIELTPGQVKQLAADVGGTVAEIETARIIMPVNDQKHTPGPWIDKTHNTGHHSIEGAGGACTVAIVAAVDGLPAPANARLIAAAPDLLEALKGMLARYASHQSGQNDPGEPAAARAAIARAEGRQ